MKWPSNLPLLRATLINLALAVACLSPFGARGSSGNPTLYLNWKTKGESLTYRSCGCADSCWVAELRKVPSKKLVVRLKCDCEKLLVSREESPSQTPLDVYRETCAGFDSTGKLDKIAREIEMLKLTLGKRKTAQ